MADSSGSWTSRGSITTGRRLVVLRFRRVTWLLVLLRWPLPARLARREALRGSRARRRFIEAIIGAALPRGELRAGINGRLPVEFERPDPNQTPGLGAAFGQRLLDAQPGQAIGEVADGLLVVKIRLADPAL